MTTLYGIKNCDTVKKAQKYLNDNSVQYQFHDFRVEGINKQLVETFIDKLGLEKVINKRSTTWKQLSDSDKENLDETSAIALCVANPTLIKRPVLEHSGNYFIGFKADDYQQIFN
jgi:Spx/MgsR family transcriptional regulator